MLGSGVVDDVRLVDPADEEGSTSMGMVNLGGVEGEFDRPSSACLFVENICFQRSEVREVRCGFAGARDDERVGEIESVGCRDTSIEWGWVGSKLKALLPEESIVAGFDC